MGSEFRSPEIGNWFAVRLDCQSARDVIIEGDAARRLDQAGDGLQPFQGPTAAGPVRKTAGRPPLQSAGIESVCALQGVAAGKTLFRDRVDPGDGFVAARQPAIGVQWSR